METAYQKWEKRRQERTGGHRPALSHRRKKGSVALGPREKRRMAQLAVCLALFLVAVSYTHLTLPTTERV